MGRTLINAGDWAIDDEAAPTARRQVRRRRQFVVALRSVFALALLALAWVAFNRFDADISYCVANWLLHPRAACWMSAYGF